VRFSSLESGGRFYVGAFSRILALVAVKMFLHLIYLIKELYEFYVLMRLAKTVWQ
jgi:hypothetical protein